MLRFEEQGEFKEGSSRNSEVQEQVHRGLSVELFSVCSRFQQAALGDWVKGDILLFCNCWNFQ